MHSSQFKMLHLCLLLCLISVRGFGQPIPDQVRFLLDDRFPDWKSIPYSIPLGCLIFDVKPDPHMLNFYKCKLNKDTIPDYAMWIVAGRGLNLCEYFIAILSEQSSYEIYVLDSCKAYEGAGERYLCLLKAGIKTNIFDDEHLKEISDYGKLSTEDGASLISFPVDALIIQPICENWYKAIEIHTYVFIKDRFYSFISAD